MYTLAHKRSYTEGFKISNSEIADVNGNYHEVKISGINREDYDNEYAYYTAIYNKLVEEGKIDRWIDYLNSIPIYTNGKCYVIYGGITTYILPENGSDIHFYYRTNGGAELISNMEEAIFAWKWKDNPWTEDSRK